jgi:hypothetical protein
MASKKILYRVLMFGAAVVLYSAAGMLLAAFGAETPKPAAGKMMDKAVQLADDASGKPQPGQREQQKISGWETTEVRGDDGRVAACMIRAHYTTGGAKGRSIATFLVASRSKGLTMLLKDSGLDLPGGPGTPIKATFKINDKAFPDFSAEVEGRDEIAIFPNHGTALAAALDDGVTAQFDAMNAETVNFAVVSGVMPWLRDCTQRWGFGFEPDAKG